MPEMSLSSALQLLRNAVDALPSSTPVAHHSGIVYRHFKTKPSAIRGDVWRETSNAYEHCFRNPGSSKVPIDNVLRGQYGMDSVVAFFEDLATLSNISSSSLFLIEQTIRQITSLVYDRIGLLPPDPAQSQAIKKCMHKLPRSDDPEHEANDRTYVPQEDLTDLLSNEEALESDGGVSIS
ncbi:hypothetical protein BDV93DRAFT_38465 [Ceratobasidium sp. AG-I]|nr:hypothetical protein BDV93DRAFT_38465 [Ceratobasidium sp. AG-I]